MTKKKAILLVLGVEVILYLFLLVGLPLFTNWLYSSCPECTGGRNFTTMLGPLVCWFLYALPLLIGALILLGILNRYKETK